MNPKAILTCQYLTRDSQHAQLRECGEPAEFRALRGRRREPIHYCKAHAELVRPHFQLTPIKHVK